jgi:hypothetical protein
MLLGFGGIVDTRAIILALGAPPVDNGSASTGDAAVNVKEK